MKLTKYEKETIILFNEAEEEASIYTHNAGLKKRLAAFSSKYPELCQLERSTAGGDVTYRIAKSRFSIRFQPPYSEERLATIRDHGKQHGFQPIRSIKKI